MGSGSVVHQNARQAKKVGSTNRRKWSDSTHRMTTEYF